MNKKTLLLTQTAILGAVALVLSAIEMAMPNIPLLLPGAKLGLSNVAIMTALEIVGLPGALYICVIKAIFAFLMRGPTSFIMSLFAGIISTIIMFILIHVHKNLFGYIGIGVGGAVTFNFVQIVVAIFIMGKVVLWYLPYMLLFSLLTGSIIGLTFFVVMPYLKRIKIFSKVEL